MIFKWVHSWKRQIIKYNTFFLKLSLFLMIYCPRHYVDSDCTVFKEHLHIVFVNHWKVIGKYCKWSMKDRLKNCLENLLTVSNNRGGESALKRIRGRNTHGQAIRSLVIPSHWIFPIFCPHFFASVGKSTIQIIRARWASRMLKMIEAGRTWSMIMRTDAKKLKHIA
jgi:hypothetical protein